MRMNKMDEKQRKIPLSCRMQAILNMLQAETQENGMLSCVADIGCDHAFVSMACIREAIAEHVIAMDVRKGPLSIAQSHIVEYGFEKSVETRLSNGFQALQVGEADWAVLAGMGGELMRTILEAGICHLQNGIGLVLQPQSEPEAVRMYLHKQNYTIIDECFLQEEGKFYTVIKAIKGEELCPEMTEAQLRYGPIVLRKKEALFAEYLKQEKAKWDDLYARLSKQTSESAKTRCAELLRENLILQEAQAWMCR